MKNLQNLTESVKVFILPILYFNDQLLRSEKKIQKSLSFNR